MCRKVRHACMVIFLPWPCLMLISLLFLTPMLACPARQGDFSFLICSPFLTAVTAAPPPQQRRGRGRSRYLALVVCNIVVTHCATDTSLISELCPTTAARTKWEGQGRTSGGRREEEREEEGEHDSIQESTSIME